MKILVTGATGFLGGHVCAGLSRRGHSVTATGRKKSTAVQLDLLDKDLLDQVIQGHDAVVHCAALSLPYGPYQNFHQANVVVTQNIVQACIKHSISRLVHISSPSIYLKTAHQLNIVESEGPGSLPTPYAKTKWLAEQIVSQHFHQLSSVILRPQGIYGPGDTTLLPRLLRAHQGSGIPLIDGGNAVTDLTHVDNVVQAIALSLTGPDSQVYNITDGNPQPITDHIAAHLGETPRYKPISYQKAMSIATIAEAMGRLFHFEAPISRQAVWYFAFSRTLNIDKARHLLGYEPEYGNSSHGCE